MKPTNFRESTKVLARPSQLTDEECQPLPVWCDGKQCVSVWRASFVERIKILFTGKIWLGVLSGKTQPPVFVSGESVFTKPPLKANLKCFWLDTKEKIASVCNCIAKAAKEDDKRLHFVVGFCIAFLIGVFSAPLGLLAAAVAGILKEWWDSKGNGEAELMDLVFTIAGGLIAVPTIVALKEIIHCIITSTI